MTWNYGNTIDTVVGGLVAIKVLETGSKMINNASKKSSGSRKKTTGSKFHKFGDSLF